MFPNSNKTNPVLVPGKLNSLGSYYGYAIVPTATISSLSYHWGLSDTSNVPVYTMDFTSTTLFYNKIHLNIQVSQVFSLKDDLSQGFYQLVINTGHYQLLPGSLNHNFVGFSSQPATCLQLLN